MEIAGLDGFNDIFTRRKTYCKKSRLKGGHFYYMMDKTIGLYMRQNNTNLDTNVFNSIFFRMCCQAFYLRFTYWNHLLKSHDFNYCDKIYKSFKYNSIVVVDAKCESNFSIYSSMGCLKGVV
jgi:hypothetical protein